MLFGLVRLGRGRHVGSVSRTRALAASALAFATAERAACAGVASSVRPPCEPRPSPALGRERHQPLQRQVDPERRDLTLDVEQRQPGFAEQLVEGLVRHKPSPRVSITQGGWSVSDQRGITACAVASTDEVRPHEDATTVNVARYQLDGNLAPRRCAELASAAIRRHPDNTLNTRQLPCELSGRVLPRLPKSVHVVGAGVGAGPNDTGRGWLER